MGEDLDLGTGGRTGRNQLRTLPQWMQKLTGLKRLDLGFNKLGELPEWIGNLTGLHSIIPQRQPLGKVPRWDEELGEPRDSLLDWLRLSVLPDFIAELEQLETSFCSEEQVDRVA